MTSVTFVILGATGDLAKRKIYPAIARLVENKKITNFAMIAVARRDKKISSILSESKKLSGSKISWKNIEKNSYYQQLDFTNEEDYRIMNDAITAIEKKHGLSGNRLFYLATLPDFFDTITNNLAKSNLTKTNGWSRVVYEKPFGHDLQSARRINKCINRVFNEKQVYRIDHYLGKDLVANIAFVRFTNRVLEPLWNRNHVASVQIIMNENIDVGTRGNYYDKTGALKDVVQNHALQLLALTAMEPPKSLSGEYVRNKKANVLKKTRVKNVLLGQYDSYRKTEGVKQNSTTETFAALELSINNRRWKGVPFFIRAGKGLHKKDVSIHINFKRVECLLDACPEDTNHFTIKVQPNAGFHLKLNSKPPGTKTEVTPVKMDFNQSAMFGGDTVKAYGILLNDVIKGDRSVFVRNDEIEYAWKIIDKIKRGRLYHYKKGSKGPQELEKWSQLHKMPWRD